MADDRSNTLGTLNDLLFQELERLNGADLGDEDAIKREVEPSAGRGRRWYASAREVTHDRDR